MLLQKQVSAMIKQIAIASVFSTTLCLPVVGIDAKAKAQEEGFSCTAATLKGSYGIQGNGFRLTAEGSYVPFGATNWRNFDGKGNYTGTGITNVQGGFARTNISGTYTVEPNCTVEINYRTTSNEGVVRDTVQSGTIVNKGREIIVLQTSPDDNVQTATYKKVR